MKTRTSMIGAFALAATLGAIPLMQMAQSASNNPASWAKNVLSDDAIQRRAAIEALRRNGPNGLQILQTTYATDIASHQRDSSTQSANWNRVRDALDKVSGQRDDWASGLYWYTDLNAAKNASRASKKPILSLRLLGRLDEELSCANSRFFRTALYANKSISQTLRDNFILHWSSERAVPIVTIDMGDGRVMKRTLTGNSLHYLMDENGRVLDALPGLFGPGAFSKWLDDATKLHATWLQTPNEKRDAFLRDYHKAQIEIAGNDYIADYEKAHSTTLPAARRQNLIKSLQETEPSPAQPTATSASFLTASKMGPELPILDLTALYGTPANTDSAGDWTWNPLAVLHAADAQLDASSKNLMRTKTAQPITDATLSKSQNAQRLAANNSSPVITRVSNQFSLQSAAPDVLQSFQSAIALDTVRNKYRLHVPIHKWFADNSFGDFASLNKKVYSELFWTPRSDPWLGLAPTGAYAALENDGVSSTR